MVDLVSKLQTDLNENGYALLEDVFDGPELELLIEGLTTALQAQSESSLQSRGQTYGSRNLLDVFPSVASLLREPSILEFIVATLGEKAGLVRVLYFDKPPGRSWSLPWHKDRTIAVQRNDLPSKVFRKPTQKAGVAHVEAPDALLQQMLTLRVHLDPMTAENGPLSVIPGSHLASDQAEPSPVELITTAGSVLAMRPLLSHSSRMPIAETSLHRRVIHFELSNSRELPDGYRWHRFARIL